MSTDQELINNILENITPTTSNEFAKVDFIDYVVDQNNGNYNSGNIKFDGLLVKDYWIHWRDAFVVIPISIYGDKALTDATPLNVALKNGVAQLIYSLQITINGEKIHNTDNLNRYNAIKQMVDDSYDYQYSAGTMYHLAKDTTTFADATEFTIVTAAVGSVSSGVPAVATVESINRNAQYNEGFYKRIQFIKNSYLAPATVGGVTTAGYWSFKAVVPFRLMSGFFKALDIPLFNCRITMNIGITDMQSSLSNSTAIMADDTADKFQTNANAANKYRMSIGNFNPAYPSSDSTSACRFYLPQVTFSALAGKKIAAMIDAGFTKVVTFHDTKTILNTNITGKIANKGNQLISVGLTPGIMNPMKIFTTITKAGSDLLHSSPSPAQSTGTLTNVNILIDGKKHYSSDILYDFQFYDHLKKEFCNAGEDTQGGSLISYQDFAGATANHKYYVNDISRFITSQPIKLKPYAIAFQGTVMEAGAFDVYHHIEYAVEVILNLSTGKVVTIGSN